MGDGDDLEKVQDLPTELLHENVGDMYLIEAVLIVSTAHGHEA